MTVVNVIVYSIIISNMAYGVKKKLSITDKEELLKLDKEDLVDMVVRLQAHTKQLRNIIAKQTEDTSILKKISGGGGDDDNYDDDLVSGCDDSINWPIIKKPTFKIKNRKRLFDFSKCSTRRVFLKFFYLGWDYSGFTLQEHTNHTIENYLFNALTKSCLISDRLTCNYSRCGRTDSGVSGAGQVIALDLRYNPNKALPYCKMLNRLMPHDIRVVAWSLVDETHNARFSCTSRTYKYYFSKGNLNISVMEEAAKYLVGVHDFRNFCKMDVGNGVTCFMREILSVSIEKVYSDNDGSNTTDQMVESGYDVYVFKLSASGFLWHQIRCIMTVLFYVGQGYEQPDITQHLLNVNVNPRKPLYPLSDHLPLIFHSCNFDFNVQWQYDSEEIDLTLQQLQAKWTEIQIKALHVKGIINDIEESSNIKSGVHQSDQLINGIKTRVHIPLLQRELCNSLETKIQHYVKRQRIELKPNGIKLHNCSTCAAKRRLESKTLTATARLQCQDRQTDEPSVVMGSE